MNHIQSLGENLKRARKKKYPHDDMKAFSVRIGVSRATLQKMEKGDLSIGMGKYYQAAELLGCADQFRTLFELKAGLFDE